MAGLSKKFFLLLLFAFYFSMSSFSLVKAEEVTSRPIDDDYRQVSCSRQNINGQFQCFGLCDNGGECQSSPTGECLCASAWEFYLCGTCPAGKPTKISGNANCDEKVDLADFRLWLGAYRKVLQNQVISTTEKQSVDLNCDRIVNLNDFRIWLENYRRELLR